MEEGQGEMDQESNGSLLEALGIHLERYPSYGRRLRPSVFAGIDLPFTDNPLVYEALMDSVERWERWLTVLDATTLLGMIRDAETDPAQEFGEVWSLIGGPVTARLEELSLEDRLMS